MGRYVKTRIVTDGLIYLNDAGNSKSYSGVGTAIKNLVGYGATNTSFNQTFVSSGTTSYFVSTGSTSYISNTNVSVSASTGRGFTICMMIKPSYQNDYYNWNYFFNQVNGNASSIDFGLLSSGFGYVFHIKKSTKIEGSVTFDSPGQYTWNVPVGVTTITAVCVGGGGGAGGSGNSYPSAGGGGGGLSFGSTISVTPGNVLYIQVGAGGIGGTSYNGSNTPTAGASGEPSYIKTGSHSGTILLQGGGGGGGGVGYLASGGTGGTSIGTSRTNGGNGGAGGSNSGGTSRGGGGGGAGGYTGNGGAGAPGGVTLAQNGSSGSGGGGGGGGNSSNSALDEIYNVGGGVGLFGNTGDGSGGIGGVANDSARGGGGGVSIVTSSSSTRRARGVPYGGGGGTKEDTISSSYVRDGGNGGWGGVRIVWGPGRTFADSNTVGTVPDVYSSDQLSSNGWNFFVFGITADYRPFSSVNGVSKTLGDVSTDWSTSPQINFDKIFGTGTSNYSCLWNNCMIYNRELTNEEIQINFEAFRRKFNL